MTDETKRDAPARAPAGGGDVFEKRLRDIKELDAKILALLARRSEMLGREGAWRRSRGKPVTDPALEKQVWAAWEEAAREHGFDSKLLRQLFGMFNFFGHGQQRGARRQADAFGLAPRLMAVDVDLPAPRSLRRSRMWALLAAATGSSLRLAPAVLNDPLIELVKALNQAGAHLSWADEVLESVGGEEALVFEDKLLFAGEEPFTFFALLAQALRGAGRCKFAGGPPLKMLDIGPLNRVLPLLGARLTSLNPHAPGLPVRLECGGPMEGRVDLPIDTPADFAAALALSAWAYPQGLILTFAQDGALQAALEDAAAVLTASGVRVQLTPGKCFVPPAVPKVPAAPELPLDPVLCAYLAALPALAGGRVRLSGAGDLPEAVLTGFADLGLAVRREGEALISEKGAPSGTPEVLFGRRPEYFPLALVLGLASNRPCRVAGPADPVVFGQGVDLLERLSARFETVEGFVALSPGELAWRESWNAPGAWFILGLSLAAFLRPGISVDNPGELTAVWPKFWAFYNALPSGRPAAVQRKDQAEHGKERKRRIRVDGKSGS